MFVNKELQDHLETSSTVKTNSLIIAEWNMNVSTNIKQVGNYRYRPLDPNFPQYNSIAQNFSTNDAVNRYYTDATDADVVVDGGLDVDDTPLAFTSKKQKEKMLYSLEDCFGKFRPRSGINKLRYFENKYSHFTNQEMSRRPRYYMSSKDDAFKYWTSYRTEDGVELGIANINANGLNYIYDAAPFVVYKDQVPTNRIVLKMQTHVGDINLGPFIDVGVSVSDPFFGDSNKTTPVRWRVQYLDNNQNWIDAISFDQNSARSDGSAIVGPDGYLELFYGLEVPESYRTDFELVKTYTNTTLLPDPTFLPNGTAYLVQTNNNDAGTVHVVRNQSSQNQGIFATFAATYGWQVLEGDPSSNNLISDLTSPPSFTNVANSEVIYREFAYVNGLRVVVETMNVFDSSFELIELSPRLTVDLTDKTLQYNVTKTASDLGLSGLPVGQLLASIGSMDIFDFDQAFFMENPNSLVQNYTTQNIQFKFYEIIKEVNGKNYYLPIKTMYSEGFPVIANRERVVSLTMRDLYFYFESLTAPQILIQNASLSYAVSLLLDSIGFSNYTFLRTEAESEDVIPYFFVAPDTSIAQALNDLAVSTQSAMFFDEYNNLVVMSKNYLLPSENQRPVDAVLYGSNNFTQDGVIRNKTTNPKLANILDISFQENPVFNDGSINYTTRSIQRAYSSIRQATLVDKNRNWIYKPSLLWEVTGSENTKSVNEESGTQSAYVLSAIPLNANLSSALPEVVDNQIINNTMDFGDGIYWIARYNGYFYANGEVIKYDAVQYSIPGLSGAERSDPNVVDDNVWISSNEEYQKYFAKVPFNGKMYPTGLVRIYAEPNYATYGGIAKLKNGPVAKHGRGQFGTQIVSHSAGIADEWLSSERLVGCAMDGKFLFNEEINKIGYTNVILASNEQSGAVFTLADPSLVNIGEYVKFDNTVNSSDSRNYFDQKNTEITAIDEANNQITISSSVSYITDEYFFPEASVVNAQYTKPTLEQLRAGSFSVTLSLADATGIEVGMYVLPQEAEDVFVISKVTAIDGNNVTISRAPDETLAIDTVYTLPVIEDNAEQNVTIDLYFGNIVFPTLTVYEKAPSKSTGKAGVDEVVVNNTSRTDVIKNIFVNQFVEETEESSSYPATIQASALVMKGNVTNTIDLPRDYISTVYKPLDQKFRHFGTRMRIIGKIENNETRGQTPEGASTYYVTENTATGQAPSISGGSGGLAIMFNPETNNGYYLEIAALTENNLDEYSADGTIYNVFFYRIDRNANATEDSAKAVPTTLFGGLAQINVDDGLFTGQGRMANENTPTVYDIAVEYEELNNARRFYIYINNQNIAIVDDENPLPVYNNMGLFVRANSKVMFENVYALTNNYSQNTTFDLDTPVQSVFGAENISAQDAFQKYAMSGLIQSTYLKGISSEQPPKYNIYYEEFGTIMREASYFNIRYDKAYPALAAQIAPTFNKVRGFTISGFTAGAYGAEFLVFNHTDTALSLDSSSGNYLRIQGVTFTQESQHEFTVDEYFDKASNFADPVFIDDNLVKSPIQADQNYTDIKLTRISEGRKEFVIDAPYVQTQDTAERMMDWLVSKIMKPRKSVGLSIFSMPTLQLGDIVTISYVGTNNFDEIAKPDQKFVVYSINHSRDSSGMNMEVYLSEVS